MTARIVYRTQYGKKFGLTVAIEETWQEITDMIDAGLKIISVAFKDK